MKTIVKSTESYEKMDQTELRAFGREVGFQVGHDAPLGKCSVKLHIGKKKLLKRATIKWHCVGYEGTYQGFEDPSRNIYAKIAFFA